MRSQFKVSERRVCRVLGQHRSTQRRLPRERADEERLVADMIELTRQYGRYGYCESFNGRMRDELLNGEIFYSLREAQIIIERWRNHYNTKRPHSALGYRPPAPEAIVPMDQRPIMH